MAKNIKSSSGDNVHPYLKGFRFWNNQRFWNNGSVTKTGVQYFDNSLEEMRVNERSVTRLTGGK
jgi:hypothetical protein